MITINARGARTLADASPLKHDGQNVYVTTEGDTSYLFLAGRIVAERPAAEITCILDAQDWAYEVIETGAETVAQVADEAAVAEVTDTEAVYADAVASVQARAFELLDRANELEETTTNLPIRRRNARGRMVTVGTNDPRHPLRAAVLLRREAAVLAEWTTADESAYSRYVSDGLADTDGWYAPLDRSSWKGSN